ncbi:MAG: magnesium chelatase [Chloroflexi bacterium]|nr:magnesium chelatase [Chloroflexota bacterium]
MNELLPYPLLGIVGQRELKTALTLALVNPAVGGVLLSGPYGVGKTTAVRGLLDIMPLVKRSRCENNCPPDDESDLCPTCLDFLARGESRLKDDLMRLIELPLNARLEDVVGGLNERVAIEQQRVVLEEGVLARANHNLLYVDEINLLDHAVVDAILDAAAQGQTFVRRGAMVKLYQSRLILIGSMNPEEGRLRPQILDRLGLRVWVGPLPNARERLEIYRRAIAFRQDRTAFRMAYAQATTQLRLDVLKARELLPKVHLTKTAERYAMQVITQLAIPSHRAEIVLLEAARARAAADDRVRATPNDIKAVAPMALRWRQSPHLSDFLQQHETDEHLIAQALQPQ